MSTTPTMPDVVAAPLDDLDLGDGACLAEREAGCGAERQRVVGVDRDVGDGPREDLPVGPVARDGAGDGAGRRGERVQCSGCRASGCRCEVPEARREGDRDGRVERTGPGAGAVDVQPQVPVEGGAGAGEVLQAGRREVDVLPREVALVERADDDVVDVERGRQRRRDLGQRDRRIAGHGAVEERSADVLQLRIGAKGTRRLRRAECGPTRAVEAGGAVDDEIAAPVGTVVGVRVVDRDVGDQDRPHGRGGLDRRADTHLADVGGEEVEFVQPGIDDRCIDEGVEVVLQRDTPQFRQFGQDCGGGLVGVEFEQGRGRADAERGARCAAVRVGGELQTPGLCPVADVGDRCRSEEERRRRAVGE